MFAFVDYQFNWLVLESGEDDLPVLVLDDGVKFDFVHLADDFTLVNLVIILIESLTSYDSELIWVIATTL